MNGQRHTRSEHQVATDHTGEEGMYLCVECRVEWPCLAVWESQPRPVADPDEVVPW